jgi:hypothetical protein
MYMNLIGISGISAFARMYVHDFYLKNLFFHRRRHWCVCVQRYSMYCSDSGTDYTSLSETELINLTTNERLGRYYL